MIKKLGKNLFLSLLIAFSLVFGAFNSSSVYAIEGENNPDEYVTPSIDEEDRNSNTNTNHETDDPDDFISVDQEIKDAEEGNDSSASNNIKDNNISSKDSTCREQTDSLSWIICPVVRVTGKASDYLYSALQNILTIDPISMEEGEPVYMVWKYACSITNIIFVLLMLVAIYSQFTGIGLSNYGIKRALPRLIIAAVMVNLSFIICSLVLDVSNLAGASLQNTFEHLLNDMFANSPGINTADFSWAALSDTLTGGVLAFGGTLAAVGGIKSLFWLIVVALFGVVISLFAGIITIMLRQGVVAILIMLAPLAIVAYILPNTEKLFRKWRELGTRMLVFYPLFSLLYGASKLIGWALIISATGPFGILLGMVIMVAPLFLSISLMKMSGTILGTVYGALTKAFSPMVRSVDAWGHSHAEQNKQAYLARNVMPGARLRNYLAYRQALRDRNIADNKTIAEGRAQEKALTTSSSYQGVDLEGNAVWKNRANRYTRTAKRASLMRTRVGTAESALQNTLSAYGDHFGQGRSLANKAASRLSLEHAKAFEGAMVQEFLTANEAQNDQEYLLNQYINAARGRYDNPYEFNRLIKNAAGSLGHNGESSIMGQVIQKSVEIENRRRREALTVMTKFGVDKPKSRAMIFNVAAIDDDGFEVDPVTGKKVEDMHHNLIGKHSDWDQFIAVHKKTGKELTSDEYNQLTVDERQNYDRIRYFDITDDSGKPVQRVYSDDVGYMKELLVKDITIGDPINRRYNYSIGLANSNAPATDHNDTGLMRRYHSTISNAMLSTQFKQHSAEVTAMLLAQADNGFINGPHMYNIANLESFLKSSTPGDVLRNDAFTLENWQYMIESINSDESGKTFEDFFPDAAVANYRNVNGKRLKGLRLAEKDGELYWQEIDRNDETLTVEDQKNFIKHSILPAVAKKLYSVLNRTTPPEVSAKQKPDSLRAQHSLTESIIQQARANENDDLSFDSRLNPNVDLFDAPNPNINRNLLETERLRHKLAKGEDLTKGERNFLRNNSVTSSQSQAQYAEEDVAFTTRSGRTVQSSGSHSSHSGSNSGNSGSNGFWASEHPIHHLDDGEEAWDTFDWDEDYDDYFRDDNFEDEEDYDDGSFTNHTGLAEIDHNIDQAEKNGTLIDGVWIYDQVKTILDYMGDADFETIADYLERFFSANQDLRQHLDSISDIISEVDAESAPTTQDDVSLIYDESTKIATLRDRILEYVSRIA